MENKPNIKEEEEAIQYKLLDLIPRERTWISKSEGRGSSGGGGGGGGGDRSHHFSSDEKKLELRLGLPGEDAEEESKPKKEQGYNGNYSRIDKFPSSTNTCVPKNYHKRAATGAVVGWPPVRTIRKNLASSSSAKPVSTILPSPPPPPPFIKSYKTTIDTTNKGLFVKINMEGVPIGRKVDLRTHDNYDKLCSAVDTLFRGLLSVQMDSTSSGVPNKQESQKPITGLLDRSGEYILVYEDHEGDRMLVGDVPWNMFVSNVKRLRVLKRSHLPCLTKGGGGKDEKHL